MAPYFNEGLYLGYRWSLVWAPTQSNHAFQLKVSTQMPDIPSSSYAQRSLIPARAHRAGPAVYLPWQPPMIARSSGDSRHSANSSRQKKWEVIKGQFRKLPHKPPRRRAANATFPHSQARPTRQPQIVDARPTPEKRDSRTVAFEHPIDHDLRNSR